MVSGDCTAIKMLLMVKVLFGLHFVLIVKLVHSAVYECIFLPQILLLLPGHAERELHYVCTEALLGEE